MPLISALPIFCTSHAMDRHADVVLASLPDRTTVIIQATSFDQFRHASGFRDADVTGTGITIIAINGFSGSAFSVDANIRFCARVAIVTRPLNRFVNTAGIRLATLIGAGIEILARDHRTRHTDTVRTEIR